MNFIRTLISIFLIALLAVSIAGWVWAGKQPSPTLEGARFVLALCGLSAIGGLGLIWSVKRPVPVE
jgi:hypothetical protein